MGSVVAQLVERLLPTPEVRSSNTLIGKIYIERLLKSKKEKEAGNGTFKNTLLEIVDSQLSDKNILFQEINLFLSHHLA